VAEPRVKRQLRDHFRKALVRHPDEWVRVKNGYGDNVHVAIVSRAFKGLNLIDRHRMSHDLLHQLPQDTWQYVTLIEEFSPSEKNTMFFPRRKTRRAKRA
jgi:stress-induced morphogen